MVASTTLKMIGASLPHNTSDTSYRKECEKGGSDKPVHDEGDDAIASNQRTMILVHSYLGQEEG